MFGTMFGLVYRGRLYWGFILGTSRYSDMLHWAFSRAIIGVKTEYALLAKPFTCFSEQDKLEVKSLGPQLHLGYPFY